jgi:hypothetical protein
VHHTVFPLLVGHLELTLLIFLGIVSDGRKFLVSTLGGSILEISSQDGSDMNQGPLVSTALKGCKGFRFRGGVL